MAGAGLGNPAGYVPVMDGGNPRAIGGLARGPIISGGVFVYVSGAAGVVSSGADSFNPKTDLLFAGDASGASFTGIAMNTTAVSGAISVATKGVCIVVCNGDIVAGAPAACDGNNAILPVGSVAGNLAAQRRIGRALTEGSSGGYVLLDLGA